MSNAKTSVDTNLYGQAGHLSPTESGEMFPGGVIDSQLESLILSEPPTIDLLRMPAGVEVNMPEPKDEASEAYLQFLADQETVTETATKPLAAAKIVLRALAPTSDDEIDKTNWQDYANCLGVDPDLFFPERGASTREAKTVCRGCVVRVDCLEYALINVERFGIWGGMSERERRRIRRARNLTRRPRAEVTVD